MQQVQLLFDNSPWLVVPSLLVGALYALLLYLKGSRFRHPGWSKPINYTLTGLRFVLVSLLCLLLVGPFLKQIKNTLEAPVVVMAIDNSSSIAAVQDSSAAPALRQQLQELQDALEEEGYALEFRTFDGSQHPDSIRFTHGSSDLSAMLSAVSSDYEGRNLASVVLFSDGIYNQGISPNYRPYSFRINTIGLGDTIPKQDINIKTLYYNKIAYQGNKFPLVAEIANTGFQGQSVSVTVKNRGRVLGTETVRFDQPRDVSSVEFLLDADTEGMQRYEVEVQTLEGEFTLQNNISQAFIEIVEGKENILILAQAPHPDIKALRSSILSNKNYNLRTVILSVDEVSARELADVRYDLVIFHQLPARGNPHPLVSEYLQKAGARWFIVGKQTDLSALNENNELINMTVSGNESDEVRAVYNNAFSGFQLDNESQAVIEEFLPLDAPFGRIELQNNPQVLLYQKVGAVETSKPLLITGEVDNRKTAVMLADGLWKWRLQEFSRYENTQALDGLISKLTQYLSAKEDKRRFKVYPVKDIFEDTEPVVFETEIYNEIYEEIYGQEVSLKVTNEKEEVRQFSYITNESNTQYRISNLPEGIYTYEASIVLDGQTLKSEGEFTVRSLQIETLNLTADFQLLRELADNSGGIFFSKDEINALADRLQAQEAKGKIYTSEAYLPIINLKWLFFVLLVLISAEWGIRKYMGSY
ncbi:MAG: hypothetical protein ACLFUB_03965 [Cyclobacteriaceae bacterium]